MRVSNMAFRASQLPSIPPDMMRVVQSQPLLLFGRENPFSEDKDEKEIAPSTPLKPKLQHNMSRQEVDRLNALYRKKADQLHLDGIGFGTPVLIAMIIYGICSGVSDRINSVKRELAAIPPAYCQERTALLQRQYLPQGWLRLANNRFDRQLDAVVAEEETRQQQSGVVCTDARFNPFNAPLPGRPKRVHK